MNLGAQPWSGLDDPSLCAAAAALQLMPENIPWLVRAQRLAAIGAGLPSRSDASGISPKRLRALLRRPEIVEGRSQENAYADIYVTEVAFHGGPRLVLQGLTQRSAHTADILLRAIFGPQGAALPEPFRKAASHVATGVLNLSHAVCTSSGLRRGTGPREGNRADPVVPSRQRLAELTANVAFTKADLAALMPPAAVAALAPLTMQAGSRAPEFSEGTDNRLILTPIVRVGDLSIVANPGELAAALRQQLIALAVAADCVPELAGAFRHVVTAFVHDTLADIGAIPKGPATSAAEGLVTRQQFTGAADTLIDVGIVTDDLSAYDLRDPFGSWNMPNPAEPAQEVLDPAGDVNSSDDHTLRLIVTDGVARSAFFGLQEHRRPGPMLLLSLDELKVMVAVAGSDPLFLWRFAQAQERLHSVARVLSYGTLDEFAIYRDSNDSFYLGDDRPPTFVPIEPGSGLTLRIEAHRARDPHLVIHPDGDRYIEVVSMYGVDTAPIYRAHTRHGFWGLTVETKSINAWVVPLVNIFDPAAEAVTNIAEAVAYWLWRLSEYEDDFLSSLTGASGRLRVTIAPADGHSWSEALARVDSDASSEPRTQGADGMAWATLTVTKPGQAEMTMRGVTWPGDAPENVADLHIAKALLGALPTVGQSVDADAVLRQLAPTPATRIIHIVNPHDVMMRPTEVPARGVIQAVTAEVLDDLGAWLADQGVARGPVPRSERSKVLAKAVDFYFTRIKSLVASLTPEGLLPFVVMHDEALIRDGATRQGFLPLRLACFGPRSVLVEDLLEDERKHTDAALASRFLVEYIAATPPSGNRPIDLFVYDELLACAADLVSRATLSDAIYYGFSDVEISMLPSGRLGMSRGDRYSAGTQAFLEAEMQARHRMALDTPAGKSRGIKKPPIDQMNEAMLAELGFSVSDLMDCLGALITLSDETGPQPVSIARSTVTQHLASTQSWNDEKIEALISALTLGPRRNFLAAKADAWPWKYNRNLSYIRRPLVATILDSGEPRLTWGVRRTYFTGRYWADLITGGRFKAESLPMRQLMGSIRQDENKAFEEQVATDLQKFGLCITKNSVKRIGGLKLTSNSGEDLGDIDAIGLDPATRVIVVGEAKDFEMSRTPVELSNEATALLEGDKSAAHKVQRRAAWVEHNLDLTVRHFTGKPAVGKWRVVPVIVTSRELLTPRVVEKASVPVVPIEGLQDWIQMSLRGRGSGRRK